MQNKDVVQQFIRMVKKIIRSDSKMQFLKARDGILSRVSSTKLIDKLFVHYWSNEVYRINQRFGASISVTEYGVNKTTIFPHGFYGIFISSGAHIGENVTIYQHCTIGSNTIKNSKSAGVPMIGDNVVIGAGAKIIGGVKIGNNVRIGANCIVVKDVPDNATVVLQEPRLIIHEEPRDNTRGSWRDYIV